MENRKELSQIRTYLEKLRSCELTDCAKNQVDVIELVIELLPKVFKTMNKATILDRLLLLYRETCTLQSYVDVDAHPDSPSYFVSTIMNLTQLLLQALLYTGGENA